MVCLSDRKIAHNSRSSDTNQSSVCMPRVRRTGKRTDIGSHRTVAVQGVQGGSALLRAFFRSSHVLPNKSEQLDSTIPTAAT